MNKPLSLADKVEAARQHYNALVAASNPARRTPAQQREVNDAHSAWEWARWEQERRETWARMEARNAAR